MGASPYPLAGEVARRRRGRAPARRIRRRGASGLAEDGASLDATGTRRSTASNWSIRTRAGACTWSTAAGGRNSTLLRALFTYPVRAERNDWQLADRFARARRPVGTRCSRGAASSAWRASTRMRSSCCVDDDAGNSRYSLPVPGYESSFRALSVHVRPAAPLTGDAAADARSGPEGHSRAASCTRPSTRGRRHRRSSSRQRTARAPLMQGETLAAGGPVVAARAEQRAGRLSDDRLAGTARSLQRQRSSATSRVDATDERTGGLPRRDSRSAIAPSAPPWLISNPIYVSAHRSNPRRQQLPRSGRRARCRSSTVAARLAGRRESDATSLSRDRRRPDDRREWSCGCDTASPGGSPVGQFAGAAVETAHGVRDYDRVAFTIRAEHPMRLSIQVRARSAERAAGALAAFDLRRCHRRASDRVASTTCGRSASRTRRAPCPKTSAPSCSSSTRRTASPARRDGSGSRTCRLEK